jgi:hypothetical protein
MPYIEDSNDKKIYSQDGSVNVYFLGADEIVAVHLEDGRVISVDMHGNYSTYRPSDFSYSQGQFPG